jgi:flagellar biosynthesis protein FlhB
MVLEKVKGWLVELAAIAIFTTLLIYSGVPLQYVFAAIAVYGGILVIARRIVSTHKVLLNKFAKNNKGFIGDMLVGLALALGIFMVVVIIVGILMAQSYVAGTQVANQISDTGTKETLTTTWTNIFTMYGYFGTWSPIIFITIFGSIAIYALYTFLGRKEKGGEGGAI